MEQVNKKLMNWASILEDNTREQAVTASTMPFIFPHIALMPDAHLGMGATVGSVIPTLGAIMPAAVGVDIGCGMIAVKTEYHERELGKDTGYNPGDRSTLQPLSTLRESIEHAIPLSAGKYNHEVNRSHTRARVESLQAKADQYGFDPAEYAGNWALQLGTLGSGNHFIEVSLDEAGRVWLFLHSGSRGVGNKIATKYIKIAQDQCAKRFIELPHKDLAYLVEGDKEFWDYIKRMTWAQQFAFENRAEMMDRVIECFGQWIGGGVDRVEEINCHHNYTVREKHWGKEVWLSRKGAINAEKGTWGLIPGSMGTASYVVEGKGNALSLNSSPHGAGRNYSRSAARQTFTQEDLEKAMTGIEWSGSSEFIDEIPQAYKPIDVVMEDAVDLVEVRHTLRQILNVKGD